MARILNPPATTRLGPTGLSEKVLASRDTSTSAGRTQERNRRVLLGFIAASGAKGVTILTALVTIPLALDSLGAERFGLWMTATALVAMATFADFGIGNGLINALSHAHGQNDRESARQYVSSAFVLLSGIAVGLGVGFAIAYPFVPWERVFNVTSSQASNEAGTAIAVLVGCFLLNLPLGIVDRIQMGYQESFVNSLWNAAGNLLGVVALIAAVVLDAGLGWMVLAIAGAPLVARAANGAFLFTRQRTWLRPSVRQSNKAASKQLFKVGLLFFVLQMAVAVAYQSDSIVIAQVINAEAVTEYSVAYRLFGFVPMLIGFGLAPLWPAYGEAITRGDLPWVKRTLFRSLKLSLGIAVPSAVLLVLFGSQIIHQWAGEAATPSSLLLVTSGVWLVMSTVGNALAMFLNGANVIRIQVICAALMAITNICLSIILGSLIGVAGVVLGTVIAYGLLSLLPLALYVPGYLRRMERPISDETINQTGVSCA